MTLISFSAYAKFDVVGTEDSGDSGLAGDVVDNSYNVFEMSGGKVNAPTSKMLGISDLNGEWWVGSNSDAPWSVFQDAAGNTGNATGANTHPSFHVTDDLVAGQSFYVGLSMQNQMKEYTSNFRITNSLLPVGTNVYFGLRNGGVPSVLAQDGAGDPLVGDLGYIDSHAGFAFKGSSTGTGGSDAPGASNPNSPLDETKFEWIHYETTTVPGSGTDTIFSLKTGKDLYTGKGKDKALKPGESGLLLTEWVAFFVLPSGMTTIAGEAWGTDPSTDVDDNREDMVFSWTVDAKSGYGPQSWPDQDPPSDIFPVPEPSSVVMLFAGAGLLCFRRQRKVA